MQPYPWLSFYGNYTKSFGLNNGVTRAGAALGPQTAIQMEGGVKAELLDKRLSVTLAYYDIKKYNIARNTPGLAGALRGFVYDLLDAESKGVEIDVTGRIDDNWSVIANFLHMNTHVTKGSTLPASDPFDIVTQAPVAGKRLPAVPENMGNLWVKYDADGAFRGWSGAIGASRVGTAWVDPANSFIAPAYTLLRAMASYRFALGPTHVTAQVNVDNLLNSTYI
nr:TonB-dependent receptor [Methylosinus sp. sav-2]